MTTNSPRSDLHNLYTQLLERRPSLDELAASRNVLEAAQRELEEETDIAALKQAMRIIEDLYWSRVYGGKK